MGPPVCIYATILCLSCKYMVYYQLFAFISYKLSLWAFIVINSYLQIQSSFRAVATFIIQNSKSQI